MEATEHELQSSIKNSFTPLSRRTDLNMRLIQTNWGRNLQHTSDCAILIEATHLRRIVLRQRMSRLSVGGQGPLEPALVGVQGAQLEQGRHSGGFVLPPVAESRTVQAGPLSEDRDSFLAPTGSYQGSS